MKPAHRLPAAPLALASLLLLPLALPCQAQFKVVGPDGKISYSDRPPSEGVAAKPVAVRNAGTPTAELPYELRQAVARYPVTYYTRATCAPCDAGRSWLRTRGVPFEEKLIANKEDNDALTRTVGNADLPAMTIGAQAVRGYSAEQWNALFDAAGYPRASQLPRNYQYAAATPLVAPPPAAEPQASAPEAPPASEAATAPAPNNPAGIKF